MAVSIQLKCFLSHLNLTYLLVSRPFYHDHLFGIFSSGGSRGGPGRPAPHPPLNLRPNGGPKSRKKFFRDRPPPPPPTYYLRVWMTTPLSLIWWSECASAVMRFHDSQVTAKQVVSLFETSCFQNCC